MQCLDILQRPPSSDTITFTDMQEEVEQMLSTYLLNGFCLLEKACPACNIPLVKRPVTNGIEALRPITIPALDVAISPLAGIAYCVKCHAHVVANTTEFQLIQGHHSSQKTGSIYFLSESASMNDSFEGTTSKETVTIESTLVTQSAGSASSSSNDYDDSLMSTSYQIEEIEVVLAATEDGDIDDDDDEDDVLDEDMEQHNATNEYPSPPPTQRMSNVETINPKETKKETEVISSPKQYVELTLNEHENLLQQCRQRNGNPRHDPSLRTVDLDEIELKGCGEDVSLLAIDENVVENRFFRDIERTTSHETAVDLAIQQSTSRIGMHKVAPALLDFPMPEFNVRREIAIKVLAGKMVQGFSIMDGQCDACLMPLMCDAKNIAVPCFVCRSIRKSYYKSLATQAVETQCLKTDSELLRQKRLQQHEVVTSEGPNQDIVKNATNEFLVTTCNEDKIAQTGPADSTTSFANDNIVTDCSDTRPESHANKEAAIDIATEQTNDETIPIPNDTTPNEALAADMALIRDYNNEVIDNAVVEPPHVSSCIDGNTDLQSECPGGLQLEEIMSERKFCEEDVLVVDEDDTNNKMLESEELNEISAAVSQCDSSIDLVRKEIGNRTQNGWTVLDKTCPECTLPLMTDASFTHETCIQCELMSVSNAITKDFNPECVPEAESIAFVPDDISDSLCAASLNEGGNEVLVADDVIYSEDTPVPGVNINIDPLKTENIDFTVVNTEMQPEYIDYEMEAATSYVGEMPTMSPDGDDTKYSNPPHVEYSRKDDSVIQLDAEQRSMVEIDGIERSTHMHLIVKEEGTCVPEETLHVESNQPANTDVADSGVAHNISNAANAIDEVEIIENARVVDRFIAEETEAGEVVESIERTTHVKTIEPTIDDYVADKPEEADSAPIAMAIDAEKVFLEISESKSHEQPSKPANIGPFHWISSRTSGSTSEKSAKPLDPPASNDPVITDIFSRNSRRLGPPGGSRFRSNKSPDGFHRVDVRSCSPIRTLSPEIQQIESINDFNGEDFDEGQDTDVVTTQTIKEIETLTAISPRIAKECDDGSNVKLVDDRPEDATVLKTSPSIEINRNFVRLEVPKTLSYNDRDAIVRLIEVATRSDGADIKNDVTTEMVGRRAASPGNSVANMPHHMSSTRSYTNSIRSASSRSQTSKMSNRYNPPSPERHAVIDCTSPSSSVPKRAPSPGLSEAPNHKTISDTSSVYSAVSSRVSRNSRPSSEYSASTGNGSERSSQQMRRRATPETAIRSKKPGLPSYIPGNPNRPHVLGSRSFQQSFPSESTAFSKTNSKYPNYPTSNQSTGSVKSMPVSNKSTSRHPGNHHIKSTSPSSTSWRERRDEIILIDDVAADERDSDVVDPNKLDALLARIETTKSQLENADDAISQYRMRDLIVNLTRSAELLQKIEEA